MAMNMLKIKFAIVRHKIPFRNSSAVLYDSRNFNCTRTLQLFHVVVYFRWLFLVKKRKKKRKGYRVILAHN